MKVVKIITLILAILGIVSGAILLLAVLILFMAGGTSYSFSDGTDTYTINLTPILVMLGISSVISIILNSICVSSISKGYRKVWVGVCQIIFGNALTGILYLVWDPSRTEKIYRDARKAASNDSLIYNSNSNTQAQAIDKEKELDTVDQLSKLKEQYDKGEISIDEFVKRKNDILNK